MPIIRKRLQVQREGMPTIDRSIVFVVGTLPEAQLRSLRGVVFHVETKIDASKLFRELHKYAKEAVTEEEIARFLDELDGNRQRERVPGVRFDQFAEDWKQTCVVNGGLTESQVLSDTSILTNHLLPYFGKLPVRNINPFQIDRYKAAKKTQKHQYGTGYSAKSVNNHLSVIHRIFEKAIEYGVIERNPVTPKAWLKLDRTPEETRAWWRPEEAAKAFRTLEAWRETRPLQRIVILVQLVTGMRFSEIRALDKRDLDLNVPEIIIRRSMARKKVGPPKNKHARRQPIPKGLAGELHRWMLSTPGEILFPGLRGGYLPNNSLNRWYARLCEEAGVPRITSHGARHTAGSSYDLMGLGQRMIAELLGHRDLGATERYTHASYDEASTIIERRWKILKGEK